MSRMVCVWLPHLPIERLKRERLRRESPHTGRTAPPADEPFALAGNETHGLTLTAVNSRSLHAGLKPGMRLADARAICPKLLTAPASPEKDAGALKALARLSSRYSPTLNVDGTDGLWLDVTGIAHLFGGERTLLADLDSRLANEGYSARLGAAETLGAAHAAARFAQISPHIVPDGTLNAALAPLPIEALRLAPETAHLLRRLGLKHIGQLYGLPRGSLERRFRSKDTAEAVLRRLDQALGNREEKRSPLSLAPDFTARLAFADPLITHDGIVAALGRLTETLCGLLARANQGARCVTLMVARTDGTSIAIEAGLSAPSRTPAHLVRLLKDKLESLDMGFRDIGFGDMGFGVDIMALTARLAEPLNPEQASLAETADRPGPEKLIDALASRLGPRTVRRLFPHESHIPELAQHIGCAFAGFPDWTEASTGEAAEKPPRPQLLLAKPESLSVMAEIPEGPPARFTWRRVSRRVIKAEGPERIAPEWWLMLEHQASLGPRDYYRIEDEDGCRYWVFREGLYQDSGTDPPRWFLHGVFP